MDDVDSLTVKEGIRCEIISLNSERCGMNLNGVKKPKWHECTTPAESENRQENGISPITSKRENCLATPSEIHEWLLIYTNLVNKFSFSLFIKSSHCDNVMMTTEN